VISTVIKEKVIEMQVTDLSGVVWRRSSHSGGGNGSQCVEVAMLADRAALRDSKMTAAPALVFEIGTVSAFVAAAGRGVWDQR
jgi:uncharacterized protein DUF397